MLDAIERIVTLEDEVRTLRARGEIGGDMSASIDHLTDQIEKLGSRLTQRMERIEGRLTLVQWMLGILIVGWSRSLSRRSPEHGRRLHVDRPQDEEARQTLDRAPMDSRRKHRADAVDIGRCDRPMEAPGLPLRLPQLAPTSNSAQRF
jgi:hypothetical protein